MFKISPSRLLFSVNNFAAAMLALGIAFSIGLPRPYWAMLTAYIISQPIAGALRSKAIYRLIGTIAGAIAAVLLVPALADAPVLLSLALALWVGGCLAVSLLDRTPRSYVVMLAGYTAAIIGFPSVGVPGAIFEVAVNRVEEISLGIICATLVHSLVFPRSVGPVLLQRLRLWLKEADQWALDLLRGEGRAADIADRRHLAAAATEIRLLAVHLPFDTDRRRETSGAVQALQDRLLMLLPILSSVADRLAALEQAGRQDHDLTEALDATAGWIVAGGGLEDADRLLDRFDALGAWKGAQDWSGLLTQSLLTRLGNLVSLLAEARGLVGHVETPEMPLGPRLAALVQNSAARPMHQDIGLALLSGFAASLAILISCALWIGPGWSDGAAAAVMAGVFCCLFAAVDDPAPAIVNFSFAFLAALPLAAFYLFVVFPAIDGFAMLTAVLAPSLIFIGYFMADPVRGPSALAVIIGFSGALTLQETFNADFAAFLNGNLAQFVGAFVAVMVTRGLRSMSIEASAHRLLRQTWRDIERTARLKSAPDLEAVAGRMVDRLGLLAPKLAAAEPEDGSGQDMLRDLRLGMNLALLQQARPSLPPAVKADLEQLLSRVGDHFGALANRWGGGSAPESGDLLAGIDQTLEGLLRNPEASGHLGLMGMVGLRRNLFPEAPAFQPIASGRPS